jgi:hypothetical protein
VARYIPPKDLDDETDDGYYELTRNGLPAALDRLELREFGGRFPVEYYCDHCWNLLDRRRQACIRLARADDN